LVWLYCTLDGNGVQYQDFDGSGVQYQDFDGSGVQYQDFDFNIIFVYVILQISWYSKYLPKDIQAYRKDVIV